MIILDTHILIWWVSNPSKLSKKIRNTIDSSLKDNHLLISSISVWEIFLLIKKNRLKLSVDVDSWIQKVEETPIQFIPVNNTIAAKSVNLPDPLHKDPADRIIIATALQEGAELITSDKRILSYPHVQTLS